MKIIFKIRLSRRKHFSIYFKPFGINFVKYIGNSTWSIRNIIK